MGRTQSDQFPGFRVVQLHPGLYVLVNPKGMEVGEAQRFYRSQGAAFSGWVVKGMGGYSDPIPNKDEALRELRMLPDDLRHDPYSQRDLSEEEFQRELDVLRNAEPGDEGEWSNRL